MRHLILAPLLLGTGLAVLSAGCTGSSKPTGPVMNAHKPTQMEMKSGKGPSHGGGNTRTIE